MPVILLANKEPNALKADAQEETGKTPKRKLPEIPGSFLTTNLFL